MRDPVMLEFLGFRGTGRLLETDLEQALLDHLQEFLLELGKGFAFVARQYRISNESKDFYIDMVFYNYRLKCFILFGSQSIAALAFRSARPPEILQLGLKAPLI